MGRQNKHVQMCQRKHTELYKQQYSLIKFSFMKKTIILASAVAALVLTSCGFGKSATTNNTTSTTTTTTTTATTADGVQMGKNAGLALENLAAQYKADGKLDMTNIMNIAQMLKTSRTKSIVRASSKV